jgi:hypothetical protein
MAAAGQTPELRLRRATGTLRQKYSKLLPHTTTTRAQLFDFGALKPLFAVSPCRYAEDYETSA